MYVAFFKDVNSLPEECKYEVRAEPFDLVKRGFTMSNSCATKGNVIILVSARVSETNEVLVNEKGKFYSEVKDFNEAFIVFEDLCVVCCKDFMFQKVRGLTNSFSKTALEVIPKTALSALGVCVQKECVYVHVSILLSQEVKDFFDGCFADINDLEVNEDLDQIIKSSFPILGGVKSE